jgi:hypothetical protein
MPSALQTQITAKSGLLAYWPLEAGSGTDVSGNGHTMSMNVNLGTNGPILAAGGSASTVFSNAYQGTVSSLTSPAAPFTVMGFMNITTFPSYYPTILGYSGNTNSMSVPANKRFSVSFGGTGQIAREAIQPSTTYMFAYTYDGSQLHMYINGRWSRSQLISGTTFTTPSTFFVGANSGTSSGTFNVGHVAVFTRALGSAELFSLFQTAVSGVQTLPTFTDVFTLVNDGLTASNIVNTAAGWPSNNQGYGLSGTAVRPGLVDSISGNAVIAAKPSSILLPCAGSLCGGFIRANEQQIVLSDGRSIHVACAQLDHPGISQPIITSLSSPTQPQYFQMAGRLLRDQLVQRTIKTAGQGNAYTEKGHYLSICEQDNTGSAFHPATVTDYDLAGNGIGDELQFGDSAAAAAMLHRYYKLPKNSWTRTYAESVVDTTLDIFLSPNGYFDSGAGDDFFVSTAMEVLMLLAPWMDSAKVNKWVNQFILIGNHWTGFTTGPSQNTFYISNSNRMLDCVMAMYMLYLITGNARWLRIYEMQYQIFFGGMPAIAGVATPPAAGTYTTIPSPTVVGDWNNAGGTTHVSYNGGYYGFTQVQAPTTTDCSDGIGFLGEADSEAPGFDQNYTTVQMSHVLRLMAWTNYDPRWVGLGNMLFNALWPYIDTVGNQITWQAGNSAGTAAGTATNDPAWSLNTELGARQYPQAYSPFSDATMFVLYYRNLRSSYPSVSPSVIAPYAQYNASYTYGGAASPATQYNSYGAITSAQLKGLWTSIETYYTSLFQNSNPSNAEWRDLGRFMPNFLRYDPNHPMPKSLGQ